MNANGWELGKSKAGTWFYREPGADHPAGFIRQNGSAFEVNTVTWRDDGEGHVLPFLTSLGVFFTLRDAQMEYAAHTTAEAVLP